MRYGTAAWRRRWHWQFPEWERRPFSALPRQRLVSFFFFLTFSQGERQRDVTPHDATRRGARSSAGGKRRDRERREEAVAVTAGKHVTFARRRQREIVRRIRASDPSLSRPFETAIADVIDLASLDAPAPDGRTFYGVDRSQNRTSRLCVNTLHTV